MKVGKSIVSYLLTLVMICTSFQGMVYAADGNGTETEGNNIVLQAADEYLPNDDYSYLVSVTTNKAVQVGEDVTAAITADADITDKDGNQLPDTALFHVRRAADNENYVSFSSKANGGNMLKSEGGLITNSNALKTEVGGWEAFTLEPQTDGTVAIRDGAANKYLEVNEDNQVVVSENGDDAASADKFILIAPKYEPDPEVNAQVWIEHKGSGNLVTVSGVADEPISVTEEVTEELPDNARFTVYYGSFNNVEVVNFQSDVYETMWKVTDGRFYQIPKQGVGGWESVTMVPQGDGTVAFKENQNNKYLTVAEGILTPTDVAVPGDNEKFIIHTDVKPTTVKNIEFTDINGDTVEMKWSPISHAVYTGYEIWRSESADGTFEKVGGETGELTYKDTGLEFGKTYYYSIYAVNGSQSRKEGRVFSVTTMQGNRPLSVNDTKLEVTDEGIALAWTAEESADSYDIYRAVSRFGEYEKITNTEENGYVDTDVDAEHPYNYYKVVSVNAHGESGLANAQAVSEEINLFGENTIIFAPTDNREAIDAEVARVYSIQKDAQFGTERYALMFKPGDYTDTSMMQVGFYTQVLGLGATPYETKLMNMETPAYLSNNNATCNFWRGAENLTIADTDNNGDDYFDFKWAVSQAAPLRRMYVQRPAQFDWYYGWASGGYAADCLFEKEAGSFSQQQFYTRNSVLMAGAYGINWNGFYQGVEGAPESNWEEGKGNSNYTNIETTDVIREKPFLYITEEGNYEVFVPELMTDSLGTSWTEDSIGYGVSLSLDEFYVAKADVDNAQTLNAALKAGKHLLLTPGIYYVDEPIVVSKKNTIVLGLGLATIIPENEEAGMIVKDVDGVTIAGIIFDTANGHTKRLLQVGEEGSNRDHSDNPTLLADLFFRVGGVYRGVASVDVALEIKSNDVIGDHFWIWRADHGDGVGWDLNTAKNGLLVNGDNVTVYGLFNEHFQEYQTLWNGENGKVYFYQCELPYDPQSQDDWMSHDGEVKGYAAYKVGTHVKNHYTIGLGIYDVLINTNGASIFLDHAIEVPNTENVIVENACVVEISGETASPVGVNKIIDGAVEGVSTSNGFERKFILKYQNGKATYVDVETDAEGNTVTTPAEEEGEPPVDTKAEIKEWLVDEIAKVEGLSATDYTPETWSVFAAALEEANKVNADTKATSAQMEEAFLALQKAKKGLVKVLSQEEEADEELVISSAKNRLASQIQTAETYKEADYTAESWKGFAQALSNAKAVSADTKATLAQLQKAFRELSEAEAALVANPKKPDENQGGTGNNQTGTGNSQTGGNQNTTDVKLTLSVAKTSILRNETTTCTVTGQTAVTYTSGNPAVATVDAKGVVTGKSAGTAVITAAYGKSTASVTITVVEPTVKWNVSYKTVPLQLKNKKKANKTKVLQPIGLQEGDAIAGYTSSKKKVAVVKMNASGKLTITPKKVGKTKITVTTKYGATATFTLKVQKGAVKLKKITVDNVKKNKVTMKKGSTFKLLVTKNFITALDKVTYKSSNKKIVTVSKSGVLKAKKNGKAKITVKCGKKTKKITVTVTK